MSYFINTVYQNKLKENNTLVTALEEAKFSGVSKFNFYGFA